MKFRWKKPVDPVLDDFPEWLVNGIKLKKHTKQRARKKNMRRAFKKNGNDKMHLTPMKHTYGYSCDVCGRMDKLTVHHKIPVLEGGTNLPDNLEILCVMCHEVRHNRRVIRTMMPNASRLPLNATDDAEVGK
jgi:5-methylcytosine-specific restriction endonuclease McrA